MLRVEQDIRALLSQLIRFDGTIALFDQSQYDWPYQRYHPYLLYPGAKFVIGIYKTPNGFTVSLGSNPWLPKPPFHIGRLCETFGGGGHAQVGGVTSSTQAAAQNVASEISEAVKRHLA